MKYFLCVFIISLTWSQSLKAQQDDFKWRVGIYSGFMNYYGDLNHRFLSPEKKIIDKPLAALSYGLSLERSISQSWSAKALYTNGKFFANDRAVDWHGDADADHSNYARSLNVRTDIQDLSLMFTFYLDNARMFGKRAIISPYLSFGGGITNFEVYGDLFDDTGNLYHYWSDNSIRDQEQTSPLAPGAEIIEQDGDYETNLTNLQTERSYKNTVFNIPVGVGLKFRFSNRLHLNFDYTTRYAFTDYLDDVSGNYSQNHNSELQAYASNPTNNDVQNRGDSRKNDFYSFASLSIHYNFGRKASNYRTSRIYPSLTYLSLNSGADGKSSPLANKKVPLSGSSHIINAVAPPYFNPVPDTKRSEQIFANAAAESDTVSTKVPLLSNSPSVNDKYRLQDDTIHQLEYELKKLKLEKELSDLRKTILQSSLIKSIQLDSLSGSKLIQQTGSTQDSLNKQYVKNVTKQKDTNRLNKVSQDPVDLDSARSTAVDSERSNAITADSLKLKSMQQQIADLRTILLSKVDAEGQTTEVKAANDQLQGEVDQLSYELRNAHSGTRVIERESNPVIHSQPDGLTAAALISLERRISLLSDEVNQTRGNNLNQDSTTLMALESAKSSEAGLHKQIDTLNSQLGAARFIQDSLKAASVLLERDSLKAQVKQLQASLDAVKKQQPDTVDREVITIPDLPKTEVFFKVNSYMLSDSDQKRLREVAEIITKYPQVAVILRGYTDKTGSAKVNKALSERRARAVEQLLLSSKVPSARIITESNGVDIDLKNRASQYGRRVEIILSTD